MRTAALALVGALALSGCSSHARTRTTGPAPSAAATPTVTSSATATSAPVASAPVATGVATPSQASSGTAAGSGCTAGPAVPTSAVTRPIPDVDGDGRADRGVIYATADGSPVIGVHTAAGGTFVAAFSSASGAQKRTVTFARIAPGGPVVALTDDNRQSQLFVVKGCHLVVAKDRRGEPYQFDLGDFGGQGDGVTCGSVAGGARTLVGFLYRRDAGGNLTGGETRTQVLLSGLQGSGSVTATNGTTRVVATRTTPDGISCGAVTEARDALRLPS